MKQYWARLSGWIDSRNIRERGLLFAVAAIVLVMGTNAFLLEPRIDQERGLSRQALEDRAATTTIQAEVQKMATTPVVDPDAENRAQLKKLTADLGVAEEAVKNLQKGLVTPDQIATMLEEILHRQGRLQLVSLTKLPLQSMNVAATQAVQDKSAGSATASATTTATAVPAAAPGGAIYKHGVEVVVQGSYLEIMNYMAELEKLPVQVFWGAVKLHVDEYPKTTLTLDLFTLSLDKKWLNI